MYQGSHSFRKPVLSFHDPHSSYVYSAQGPQQVPVSVPMTPMDYAYSQSMLPSNLLSTPSPYVNHPSFLSSQQSFMAPPASPYGVPGSANSLGGGAFSFPRVSSSPMLPYGTQNSHQQQQRQPSQTSHEHLNFSRTVVLSGISPNLTIREILDEIDHGPIEFVQLKEESSDVQEHGPLTQAKGSNACHISFVNTHISYHFHHKYAKNPQNLKSLRENLKDSSALKVSVNDAAKISSPVKKTASTRGEQDYIKVKTLNYIMEFDATRAIRIAFRILDSDLVPLMEKAFRTRCSKFGEIEHIVVTEDEENSELEFILHFTSIDAAIKVYEHYSNKLTSESSNATPAGDDRADLVQLSCLYVAFSRDRCDRAELAEARLCFQRPPAHSSDVGSLHSASPLPSDPKVSQIFHRNSSSGNSVSPESSRASDLRSDFKALNISPEQPNPDQDLEPGCTRATSEHSTSEVDPKNSFEEAVNFAGKSDIHFGSDGSGPASPSIGPTDYYADQSFNSVYSGFPSDPYLHHQSMVFSAGYPGSANASFVSLPPQPPSNAESLTSGNRTLYLGNLHQKTTVEEIANNVRAGGLVESIKHYQSRRVCFITFVDPAIALKFYLSHQVLHQLVIRDSEISVKWGKTHSGALPTDIAYAVNSGASRNVYIGFRMNKTGPPNLRIPDEATLRRDFSKFGGMEQINYYRQKDCGFMNFLNIADAITVVECFDSRDANRIRTIVGDEGQFFEKYRHFKISYGKDRCGNPLKFSYVKRDSDSMTETSSMTHSIPRNVLPSRIDPINEEAAYVFGISTNQEDGGKESSENIADATMVHEGDADPSYSGTISEEIVAPKNAADDNLTLRKVSLIEKRKKEAASRVSSKQAVPVTQPELNGEEEEDEDENESADDADEDDDISIIINSETTGTPSKKTPYKHTPYRQTPRKSHRKAQKVYHDNFELSDLINAAYNSGAESPMTHASYNSSFEQSTPVGSVSSPTPLFRPPQVPYARTFSRAPPSFPPIHQLQNGTYGPPSPYGSGSQVMSDYLARASNEHYLYAAMLHGDTSYDDIRDTRRSSRRSSKR
ncbi:hypothetical protein JCM33374_g276 [Metschnikowia sp. JCM 33374]|nr:hypothetical protein JCM33374_g276 [Metschnikowia sp. JCM 33374]